MNPLNAMKIVPLVKRFNENHPKVAPFFQAVSSRFREDCVLEIQFKEPDGQVIVSNIKITNDDIELLNELMKLKNE